MMNGMDSAFEDEVRTFLQDYMRVCMKHGFMLSDGDTSELYVMDIATGATMAQAKLQFQCTLEVNDPF